MLAVGKCARNPKSTSWTIGLTPTPRGALAGPRGKMPRMIALFLNITIFRFLHRKVESTFAKISRWKSERQTSSLYIASPRSFSKPAGRERSNNARTRKPWSWTPRGLAPKIHTLWYVHYCADVVTLFLRLNGGGYGCPTPKRTIGCGPTWRVLHMRAMKKRK